MGRRGDAGTSASKPSDCAKRLRATGCVIEKTSNTPYVRVERRGCSTLHSAAVISKGRHRRCPTWHKQL
eukprot:4389385-Pyramimonas_sp.AAC.1